MKLAILHHHLNPGGVTRVIENHLRALAGPSTERLGLQRVVLIHGGRTHQWPMQKLADAVPFSLSLRAVEGFDYDLTNQRADERLGKRLAEALAAAGCDPPGTILHWHNHSLGKNASTSLAVAHLARRGFRTLCQIHDFAEDFRPQNYRYLHRKLAEPRGVPLSELLYPQGPAIHYAVLNGRDRGVLSRAGVASERLHFLPNPASAPEISPDRARARAAATSSLQLAEGRALVVYPVRGIRRKNLGELALWSAAIEGADFAVTLRPQNPQERHAFDYWAALGAELQLPCRFGVPAQLQFGQTLAASDALLTTSVAEGFGLTFLEAWLAGRPLVGRQLPEVTQDFSECGIVLDHLYEELAVPTEWVDQRTFLAEMSELAKSLYRDFAVDPPDAAAIRMQLDELLSGETIDFARLPMRLQAEVVRRVAGLRGPGEKLRSCNRRLQLPDDQVKARIDPNAAAIGQHFSLERVGQILTNAYVALQQSTPSDTIGPLPAGEAILDAFLSIDRLHAIRVES